MVFLRDGVVILPKLDRRFFSEDRGVLGCILEVDIDTRRLGVLLLVLPGVTLSLSDDCSETFGMILTKERITFRSRDTEHEKEAHFPLTPFGTSTL